jgi:hypothetical protein
MQLERQTRVPLRIGHLEQVDLLDGPRDVEKRVDSTERGLGPIDHALSGLRLGEILSMTSTFAPVASTASAVLPRFARSRATRTSDEKSRARRMAVERPMPWLAPVMIATDFSIPTSPSKGP